MTMNDTALTGTTPRVERPVLIADDLLLVRDGLTLLVSSILGPVEFLDGLPVVKHLNFKGRRPS